MSVPKLPEDKPKRPIPTVPPPTLASPHKIDFGDGPERWWKPSLGEIWSQMGWRRVLLLPAVGLIAIMAGCLLSPRIASWFWAIFLVFGKGSLVLIALPFAAAAGAISSTVAARKGPFCIHCGYDLTNLPDHHHCPECGMPYDWATIEEYRRDPKWFIHRWREMRDFPGMFDSFEAGPARSPKDRDDT